MAALKSKLTPVLYVDGIAVSLLSYTSGGVEEYAFIGSSRKQYIQTSLGTYVFTLPSGAELTCTPKYTETHGDVVYLYGILYNDYPNDAWKVACASAFNNNNKGAIYKYRNEDPFWSGDYAKGFYAAYTAQLDTISKLDDRVTELENKLDDYCCF